MTKRSKSYRAAAEKVHADVLYTPFEAMKLAKETTVTKFDSTVEVVFRLGVDPRQADQMVRGTVSLPHGTGKTALARALAASVQGTHSRIQFTPDLMPTDVLGTSIFNLGTQQFDFHPGPVFTQVLLVDEINRAPAKTQAALFEVMEERQVTLDGKTRKLDPCYLVIATQNPVEQEGTYRLPEAQLDRFLLKIDMGYPPHQEGLENPPRKNNVIFDRTLSGDCP